MGVEVTALDNEPHIPPLLADIWEGFWFLSAGRFVGFGPSGISTVDIVACVELFNIRHPIEFARMVRALDRDFLEHYRQRA